MIYGGLMKQNIQSVQETITLRSISEQINNYDSINTEMKSKQDNNLEISYPVLGVTHYK